MKRCAFLCISSIHIKTHFFEERKSSSLISLRCDMHHVYPMLIRLERICSLHKQVPDYGDVPMERSIMQRSESLLINSLLVYPFLDDLLSVTAVGHHWVVQHVLQQQLCHF